jgi:hypothetical protein
VTRKTDNPDFDSFWNAYPRRLGDEGKGPAKDLFEKAVKSGINPKDIIFAAKKYAELEKPRAGTQYIMQAQKWLRHRRWEDFPAPTLLEAPVPTQVFVRDDSPQWLAWQDYLKKTKGKGSPCVNFGWHFPSEWPPEITHQ